MEEASRFVETLPLGKMQTGFVLFFNDYNVTYWTENPIREAEFPSGPLKHVLERQGWEAPRAFESQDLDCKHW